MKKIEGYFANTAKANEVIENLKKDGIDARLTNISSSAATTSAFALEAGDDSYSGNTAPLSTDDPINSNIGTFKGLPDCTCKIVIETTQKDIDKVKTLISQSGGKLTNSNLTAPDRKMM